MVRARLVMRDLPRPPACHVGSRGGAALNYLVVRSRSLVMSMLLFTDPCDGIAVGAEKPDPSSKMPSLAADKASPRRLTRILMAPSLAEHLLEGVRQLRRGLCPSPLRFLRSVGEGPLYGLERLP